jgi:apolipoprotein N-acyltransferase
MSTRLRSLFALLSGVLYCLGFAGFDIWPLALIAFVPLLIALEGTTPTLALRLGLLAGTAMNVGGFYWLMGMLKTFSGFPTPVCMLFVLIICTFQGGRSAFTAWLYARARMRGHGDGALRYGRLRILAAPFL